MLVVAIGLMVVLYPISPTLAPLPVLIRYGSIPCVVPIRHGSIPGAVLESVKLSIVERGYDTVAVIDMVQFLLLY